MNYLPMPLSLSTMSLSVVWRMLCEDDESIDWVEDIGEMSFSLQANSMAKLSNRNLFDELRLVLQADIFDFGVIAFSIFFVTIDAFRQ